MLHHHDQGKWSLTTVTAAVEEPVSSAQMKLHLRQDLDDDDDLISTLIQAATEDASDFVGRQFCTATFDYFLDRFPHAQNIIELPLPPVQSITSVKYVNNDGDTTTLVEGTDYDVDTDAEPARIYPSFSQTWPTDVRVHPKSVTIRFIAGYTTVANVPSAFKAAIKLTVGHWYDNREEVVVGVTANKLPRAVERLLWKKRVFFEAM